MTISHLVKSRLELNVGTESKTLKEMCLLAFFHDLSNLLFYTTHDYLPGMAILTMVWTLPNQVTDQYDESSFIIEVPPSQIIPARV